MPEKSQFSKVFARSTNLAQVGLQICEPGGSKPARLAARYLPFQIPQFLRLIAMRGPDEAVRFVFPGCEQKTAKGDVPTVDWLSCRCHESMRLPGPLSSLLESSNTRRNSLF